MIQPKGTLKLPEIKEPYQKRARPIVIDEAYPFNK